MDGSLRMSETQTNTESTRASSGDVSLCGSSPGDLIPKIFSVASEFAVHGIGAPTLSSLFHGSGRSRIEAIPENQEHLGMISILHLSAMP
jgi:hypothetical protein